MQRIVRVSLGRKDSVIKTWWQMALAEGKNVSAMITKAIYYHEKTGEYLVLGNISEPDTGLPDVRKVVSLKETEDMHEILDAWMRGDGISSAVRRILRKGIRTGAGGNQTADLDTLIDQLEAADRQAGVYAGRMLPTAAKQEETGMPAPVPTEIIPENQGNRGMVQDRKKEEKGKTNFMLGMIPDGCGLGE